MTPGNTSITINAIAKKYLTALVRKIHPDLFVQHPTIRSTNQSSLQELNALFGPIVSSSSSSINNNTSMHRQRPRHVAVKFYTSPPPSPSTCIQHSFTIPSFTNKSNHTKLLTASLLSLCEKANIPIDPDHAQLLNTPSSSASTQQHEFKKTKPNPQPQVGIFQQAFRLNTTNYTTKSATTQLPLHFWTTSHRVFFHSSLSQDQIQYFKTWFESSFNELNYSSWQDLRIMVTNDFDWEGNMEGMLGVAWNTDVPLFLRLLKIRSDNARKEFKKLLEKR